ncbi:hypothetical protein [Shewanella xiamenensis]|uniref:hypothetical protein n=1 Tax=Shewanella xiamenensis TaxID=332186 RepID=UPI0008498E9A|nr:hypothetical protein [Shewanella xiamenensis]ODR87070.1 hypothetical protein ABT47_18220 [Shewanella xiamenensis]
MSQQENNKMQQHFYRASAADFGKIPGSPVAYWASDGIRKLYTNNKLSGDLSNAVVGLQTGDNDRFMRFWYEVNKSDINYCLSSTDESQHVTTKWVPYNKGGAYRKWYGNREYIVNWEYDGLEIRNFKDDSGKLRSRPQNTSYYFKEGMTWSVVFIILCHFSKIFKNRNDT